VAALAEALPAGIRAEVDVDALDVLSDYAVSTRYPGPFEEPSFEDSLSAIRIAEQIAGTTARHLADTGNLTGR
jgi:hypothetical protein